eukprot:TRINITY_DN7550_c0_g1_i2.p1 TRINITY_DN7550_c0_g1~~TRINITY_DN7550_c0_g1_i2.p1  ORF type:complete len:115 (-),score=22.44 TRINITY_DN7550_c0_g1_i2:92-436(-)
MKCSTCALQQQSSLLGLLLWLLAEVAAEIVVGGLTGVVVAAAGGVTRDPVFAGDVVAWNACTLTLPSTSTCHQNCHPMVPSCYEFVSSQELAFNPLAIQIARNKFGNVPNMRAF